MNLLEKKSDSQIIRWKPFATSTPLKSISGNPNVKNGNCPVRPTHFVQGITKRVSDVSKSIENKQTLESKIENRIIGKNRSRAYFDLSSSSSDDDDYKVENRPVIKLGTENSDKSKVVGVNGKYSRKIKVTKNSCSIKRKVGSAKFQSNKCETEQKQKNKAEGKSEVPKLDLEKSDSSLNQKKSLPITMNSLSKENNKSLCLASKFILRSKRIGKPVTKVNGKNTALEAKGENQENAKNMPNLLKRKGIGDRNAVKTKKRKGVQTVLAKKWANSSHQLFTDSVQEELISTLCLITPEVDEFIKDLNRTKVCQKSVTKLKGNKIVKTGSSEEAIEKFASVVEKQQRPKITRLGKNEAIKIASSNECEVAKEFPIAVETQGRPKRTRQAPKKYWLVNDKPKLLKDKSMCIRQPKKKPATQCEYVSDQALETVAGKNLNITHIAPESKKISASQSNVLNNCHNQGNEKPKSRIGKKKVESPSIDTKLENASEQPVFLPLNKISYLENEFGHQISQIWSIKNFNCEIFKLKPGSNFMWKSSQGNNYMGGVLIKGEMKMTIEGKEHVLQEGDMVLIPPLSKYQASNTSECDLVFYYWTFNK